MRNNKKEFVLFFRMDITTPGAQPSPEQMREYMKQWNHWLAGIKRVKGGNHLSPEGRVLKTKGVVIKGPYVEKKESVAGYITILSRNLTEAVKIAKACPILKGKGTSVEVREAASR